jgi:hypothetical protein
MSSSDLSMDARMDDILEEQYHIDVDEVLRCPLAELGDAGHRSYSLRLFCTPLLHAVRRQDAHFEKLDQQLSSLLPQCDSASRSPSSPELEKNAWAHRVKANVKDLLARLPRVPQRSFSLPLNNSLMREAGATLWDGIKSGRWAELFVLPEARAQLRQQPGESAEAILGLLERMQHLAWDNLYVTRIVDSNSLRLAVHFADQHVQPNLRLAQRSLLYVNLLAELFDEYQSVYDAVAFGQEGPFEDSSEEGRALKHALFPENRQDHTQSMAIIKVFLWSAWQRSVMLHFYYVIGVQLAHGYSSSWNALLAVRGVQELRDLTADDYRGHCTEYMCNWAFKLLRTSRTSVGLDFRRMISRFDAHFQKRSGRCIPDSDEACFTDDPETCHRFTAAATIEQSAHEPSCDRSCPKVTWTASSYLECLKPAAVVATLVNEPQTLKYSPVTENTLAISHVWSHGQGGRPETGINLCLHQRYCRLAHAFECDTYCKLHRQIPFLLACARTCGSG